MSGTDAYFSFQLAGEIFGVGVAVGFGLCLALIVHVEKRSKKR